MGEETGEEVLLSEGEEVNVEDKEGMGDGDEEEEEPIKVEESGSVGEGGEEKKRESLLSSPATKVDDEEIGESILKGRETPEEEEPLLLATVAEWVTF